MARNNREVLRVGVPIGASRLVTLLTTLELSADATVRHHDRQLIVEEPNPTLPTDGDDADVKS